MPTDVLAIGELLVDLIGASESSGLAETAQFERFQGGSPANLCRTLALAGRRPTLVASVGADGLGDFARTALEDQGVDVRSVATLPHVPTSIVLLSRTPDTPEFAVYRHADALIEPGHVPEQALDEARVVHTTCFALSRTPARTTILDVADRVAGTDTTLTLDANYAPGVWPDRFEARGIVQEFCRTGPLVKVSSDDLDRLFGTGTDAGPASTDFEAALETLHDWGAELVCWTRGRDGSVVSWNGGDRREAMGAPDVDVVDATGAGDAFWAGFLHAHLANASPPECARTGSRFAAHKLAQAGPLTSVPTDP